MFVSQINECPVKRLHVPATERLCEYESDEQLSALEVLSLTDGRKSNNAIVITFHTTRKYSTVQQTSKRRWLSRESDRKLSELFCIVGQLLRAIIGQNHM